MCVCVGGGLLYIRMCVYVFVCKGGLWGSEGEASEVTAVIKGVLLCLLLIGAGRQKGTGR